MTEVIQDVESFDDDFDEIQVPTQQPVMEYQEKFPEPLLFGRWSLDFDCKQISLKDHICVKEKKIFLPHCSKRFSKRFGKSKCPIVERLVNSLMMHGRNSGKKLLAIRIVKDAFDIVHLLTGINPVEVLVEAIVNAGPREDSTRIGKGGAVRRQAVDVSPLRRVNVAIYNMTTGARNSSFKSLKTISECLADEIINTYKGTNNSFAIKKKDEIERVAKSNR